MPIEAVEAVVGWLATRDAPNGLLLLAALTRPATWSRLAVEAVRSRLPGGGAEATVGAEAEGQTSSSD